MDHVTPTIAKNLLAAHGLRAGRRHGQHFLVDPNTVRRIVRLAAIDPDETILEIGPGLGSLTVGLSQACRRVVAIEVDPLVATAMGEVVGGATNVELVVGDALQVDIAAACNGAARLVANLPYNVATPLLMKVLDEVPQVSGGLVMVQRELGERWVARPGAGAYGAPSVHVAFLAEASIVGDVPATVFLPRPKVASVLVAFTRRARPAVDVDDPASFLGFVRSVFGHRRKTMRNALRSPVLDREKIQRCLDGAGVNGSARPERLDIYEFARIYDALRSA